MKKLIVLFLVSMLALSLTSCGMFGGADKEAEDDPTEVVAQETAGEKFLTSNLKLKSQIIDNTVSPARAIDVELYVDGNGNGKGLLSVGERLCNVIVSGDILYVFVDDNVAVSISDLSGRLFIAGSVTENTNDMVSSGFTMSGDFPVEYAARYGDITVKTKYAQSNNTFEYRNVASAGSMGVTEVLDYIADYYTDAAINVKEEEPKHELESFYIKSEYGVVLDNTVFSIGDTCEPSTYFNGSTPEGLLTSHAYKQDTRVDFLHASYISDTGRTVFTLTSNYVQAIESNAEFEWLSIKKGMTDKELKYLLGYKLSKNDSENWKPMDEELSCNNYSGNTFYCTLGMLSIELRCLSGVLDTIYIERSLDYVK